MHLIGRWARVRSLGPRGYGLPWMLDRKWNTLSGFQHDEWYRTRQGVWRPALRGGVGISGLYQLGGMMALPVAQNASGLTRSTLTLDSNYAAGTGGDATAAQWTPTENLTVNNIYFFITAYTGTAANVNDINWEIRTGATTAPDTTAPGLVASGTKDPASATGWINISGLSTALTGGTQYWFIIGDADGNGTDNAIVCRGVTHGFSSGQNEDHLYPAASTADGWGTTSAVSRLATIVVVFSNGSVIGHPLSTSGTVTSNTLQKGLLISGVTEDLDVYGFISGSGSANYTGVNLWEGSNGPGGGADAVADNAMRVPGTTTLRGFRFDTPERLTGDTAYRFVFTYGSNTNLPAKYDIGTGADANLRLAMIGGGSWKWTEEVAGPAWDDDDDAWPNMALLVEDQVAITSGSMGISQGLHTVSNQISA